METKGYMEFGIIKPKPRGNGKLVVGGHFFFSLFFFPFVCHHRENQSAFILLTAVSPVPNTHCLAITFLHVAIILLSGHGNTVGT